MRYFLCFLLALGAASLRAQETKAPAPSIVAVAQDRRSIVDFQPDAAAVQAMVDALVREVTGQPTVARAWASLVKPGDKVGLKVSTDGGRFFSTHIEVVEAVVRGLQQAGIPRRDVIVWDRSEAGLRAAGYLPARSGYQVAWTEPASGYDPQQQVTSAVLGKLIWGDVKFRAKPAASLAPGDYDEEQLSSTSFLDKTLARRVTHVINLPVLSDDMNCGLAGCLYNMTVRTLDNWRRFTQPPGYGDPYLAELYADERIGGKVVFNLMDGLLAQYAFGPRADPNYAFPFGTLYASRDPVAIDATALRLIDGWRREAKLPGVLAKGTYLDTAALMGLGQTAPERIDYRIVRGSGPTVR